MSAENLAFTAKVIGSAQHLGPDDKMRPVLTEYLQRVGRIAWHDDRALFFVEHPQDGWQVAVWLMPEALQFEPRQPTGAV